MIGEKEGANKAREYGTIALSIRGTRRLASQECRPVQEEETAAVHLAQ